ncbi:hypothetical protein PR202_gb08591 [Eleusine coracana subsp. coracana]|uniref:Leucine-rich repeat-containing N-terminal plant-type domain-containing protein n=1 Tax=Eleusine coracana subsp. coracana TaxID=191504 RepID=A0AAV5EES1_ELECO|nr:hypothetical protein PR202_gb08591 [Eleusine coracana subsp. coracana]
MSLINLLLTILAVLVALTPAASEPSPGNAADLAALLSFKAELPDPLGVLRHNWSNSTTLAAGLAYHAANDTQGA